MFLGGSGSGVINRAYPLTLQKIKKENNNKTQCLT